MDSSPFIHKRPSLQWLLQTVRLADSSIEFKILFLTIENTQLANIDLTWRLTTYPNLKSRNDTNIYPVHLDAVY